MPWPQDGVEAEMNRRTEDMPLTRRSRYQASYIFLGVAGLFAVVAIVMMARTVIEEMQLLESASSDNVQWSLSQTEVEFLEFYNRVATDLRDPDPDLASLRRRFDIFYSRIMTLSDAPVYARLRSDPAYAANLSEIRGFLDEAVPLIDAPDDQLRAALPQLEQMATFQRLTLRRLSTAGLQFFAAAAEVKRQEIARTLVELGATIAGLVIALGLLAVYLNRLNIQNIRRGRVIRQTSQRMNTVISTSLDGVIVSDSSGSILDFNTAAEKIFGYTTGSVLGRNIADVIIPERYRGAHELAMRRLHDKEGRRVVGKGRIKLEGRRKDGTIFPVELAVQSAETREGEIFIAFLRDISPRVKAEAELIAARDQALAGEKAKSDFLAVMSHEIRTPLNGLLGNLSLLGDTRLTDRQAEYVGNMETSGRLLMRHVTDVLDITRYDAGKLELKPEPLHLDALLQELVDNQGGLAAANDTQLDWRWVGAPLGWVEADRDRLQHILLNLVGNAVKFTHGGRVTVELEVIGGSKGRPLVELRVIDTGVGIAPDQLERIFDDFVTGNISYDRAAGGTGLGLGIVKRFAEAMGGSIKAESTQGAGSVFRVNLPMRSVDAPGQGRPAQRSADKGRAVQPLDVLVVEDNEINRQVVREMLRGAGHQVNEAVNGRDGVQAAHGHRYDLILMDISMPVMDGRSATQAIRAGDGASRAAPIVALTANVRPEERAAFLTDGMNDILTKPLTREALYSVIDALQLDRSPMPETPPEPAPETAAPSADALHVDTAQLDELRDTLGAEGTTAMLERFAEEVDALLDWLAQDHPLAEIQARSHKTAGSAAMFGAIALRGTLVEIETAAKTGDTAAIRAAIQALPGTWAGTRAALDA